LKIFTQSSKFAVTLTFDLGEGFPPEYPMPEVPGDTVECKPSMPVPESSGNVVSFRIGEKSMDASLVPTNDLLGVSGAEKLKRRKPEFT
jgi:hypothetical protein